MQLLKNQTTNTSGDGWYRPGKGRYTVGAIGEWDGATVQLQIGKQQHDDSSNAGIEALPDDPDLVVNEGDAPFTLELDDQDWIRADVSNAGGSTDIDLWVG